MLTESPGFFADVGRYDLSTALRKRRQAYQVGGRSFKAEELAGWDATQLEWLINQSIVERQVEPMGWAFEHVLIKHHGNFGAVWMRMLYLLNNHQEEAALPAVDRMLKYLPSPELLKAMDHGAWGHYLLGKHYASAAFGAKGVNKNNLQTNKQLALHFLGQSRSQVEWQRTQPSADPYRTAAMAAALGAAVAATYEGVAYLQWKGTRTTALAE